MESKYKKVGKYLAEGMLSIDTAKAYLHSILANCREVIYRYNFQTQRYDYISNSIETLTGYTPQEIKDQGINYLLQNLHSNDKSAFMDLYFGLLNSKVTDSTVEIEYRIRHKNGTYIWQDDVISIIRDESGKILATVGAIRDITQRKERERELQASKDRFKRLSEASFEGICIHDGKEILDANQRFLDMLGYASLDDVKNTDCFNFIAPECHEEAREKISKKTQDPYDSLALKKDGSRIPVQIHARECMWNGKRVRIATFRDLTDQKDLEKQLKKNRDHFKHLFENAPNAIFIANVESGIIIEANSKAAELLGIPEDQIIGMHQSKLHPPEEAEKYKAIFRSHIQSDIPPISSEDIYVQHKNGRKIPVQINASIISINNQRLVYGIFRDMTEQIKLQQQLAESERLYKELYQNAKAALYRTRIHDGKLLACNMELAQMHGYNSAEECLRKHHGTNHYVDKNRREQLLNALYKNKRVENFEYQIRRPDGTKTWLSLAAEIFPENGWIEGVVTDITPFKSLTPTEMKILKILLTGKSNKEIAFHLDRSIRTIEDHRSHIMRKLGVDNVVDMTRKALECGIRPENG